MLDKKTSFEEFKNLLYKSKGETKIAKKFSIKDRFKSLPHLLSKKEKLLLLLLLGIIFFALSVLGWRILWRHIQILPSYGGSYTEGVLGEPKYINPLLAQTNDVDMDLSALVFSGLLRYDQKQKLVPDLAESYKISKDQKNYIFYLRKGLKWHDGKDFNADDVIFTVNSIKNPDFKSPLYPLFLGVTCEKIDDFSVKFTLVEKLYAPFLAENTTFGILPKHLWETILPKNASLAELNLEPIGLGPYKFKEYKKNKEGQIISYTLYSNKDYHLGRPYLEKITFKFYQDISEIIAAYNKKEIQGLHLFSFEQKKDIKRKANFYSLKLPRYFAIFFNSPRNEIFEDKAVRQAFAYGINKQEIIDQVFQGEASPQNGPILPNFLGYNPKIKIYPYDPKKAHKILHQAGFNKVDKEGKRWKGNVRLELSLRTVNKPEFIKMTELLKKQWEELGGVIHIEAYEPTELQTKFIRPRNYEALLFGQLLGHDPDPYPFWHSSQRLDPGLNLTSFKDETVDELLESARQTTNQKSRRLKYLHFQNILAEEVPAIFLVSPTTTYIVDKKIRGIELDYITYPSDRLSDTSKWYIKINRKWKSNN